MNLRSPYLNPFQPFPEREADSREMDHCQDAIENNLSRAIFSAIGNAETSEPIATFLEALAPHGSASLAARIRALAGTLRATEPSKIEIDLQSWPKDAILERDKLDVVLIGISSSHERTWTHNKRCAPENPQPDAWVYIPGRLLLVFECKIDEHPLDATQISSYAHELKLLTEDQRVPGASPKQSLLSKEEAKTVQASCANVVLDVPWTTVANALERVRDSKDGGSLGRCLCGNAASYIRSNIYPPYGGTQTIADWLSGPDTPDRRKHLRRLVGALGENLADSCRDIENGISFEKTGDERELGPGALSAVYVKLKRGEQLLEMNWLDRQVCAVLWFTFTKDEAEQIGLSFYLQSRGSCAARMDPCSWNEACARHEACANEFENTLAQWIPFAPRDARIVVSPIGFKGNKRNWHGGGRSYYQEFQSPEIPPDAVVKFLREHRDALWRFPRVETEAEIPEAASQVRKPSISLLAPLDRQDFIQCGNDAFKLQTLLKKSVDASSVDSLSDRDQTCVESAGQ